jgi:hypothetical protein
MGSQVFENVLQEFPPTRSYACIARGLVIALDFALGVAGSLSTSLVLSPLDLANTRLDR